MKHTNQIFYGFMVAGAVLVGGCSVKTNMLNNNYTVTPNPLEMKGDSIAVTINATVPAKSINPKASIQFQPYLKTPGGSEVPLKAVTIGGEKVTENVDIKVTSKTGGKITYSDKIAYTADLKRVTLYPKFAVKVKGVYQPLEAKGVPYKALAEGTNITPLLVMSTSGNMVYDGTQYAAVTSNKMVNIYFPIDVDKFSTSFKMKGMFDNKKQIDSLKKILKADKNWMVKGISINAFASPDGELQRNEGLAKGRSESTFSYFKKELKKLGFTEANDQNFKMGYALAEDWAGYAKALEASTHPDKDGVLQIVNNKNINDNEREAQIKQQFPKFWEATKNKLLPPLRRSELVVMGQNPLKNDSELVAYMGKLDSLTDLELLHLGEVTTDLGAKEKVYSVMVTKYPEDWRGYNDLGAVQLQAGKQSEGTANIERANTLSPENPVVLANLGNVALNTNDYNKAKDYYGKAAAKGADVSYGLGVLAIKQGNYGDAVTQINKSGKKDFNLALARLLNGDVNAAKSTIDDMAPEQMTWQCYYLRAIIGARNSDQDLMTTNLTRAIQMNADVRGKAKDDVEFIKYWSNPAFQGAIR